MSELLTHALVYAARGWSVIPVKGKVAVCKWERFQANRPTEAELRRLFNRKGITGLAVICGPVSGGVCVRDFDDMSAYDAWARQYGDLAASLATVITSRGRHVYFHSDITDIRTLGDGELRGGGYCVLPPSIHPSGALYEWVNPLPDGPPSFIDPYQAGLIDGIQRDRDTENQRDREIEILNDTDEMEAISVKCIGISEPIESAIRQSLPDCEHQRERRLFDFARRLKALPECAGLPARELREIVREWHRRALPNIATKDFDSTYSAFCRAWPKVKKPKGYGPMEQALARAKAGQLPAVAMRYDCPRTRLLVAVCYELQRETGDAPFFLSARMAGDCIDLGVSAANDRLCMLVADGVITLAEPHTSTRAARYRWGCKA